MILIEKAIANCSDILSIKIREVQYRQFEKKDISAMFFPSSFGIVFNELWLKTANPIEVFVTTCHEARHAYQYSQIKFPKISKEDSERILKWKVEFENYFSPIEGLKFLNQDIDIDAIAFAHYMTLKIFNEKSVIPIEIKERVTERLNQISKIIKE